MSHIDKNWFFFSWLCSVHRKRKQSAIVAEERKKEIEYGNEKKRNNSQEWKLVGSLAIITPTVARSQVHGKYVIIDIDTQS